MRNALRLKHYSYRTERSYIDWIRRFYDYMMNTKKKDIEKLESEVGEENCIVWYSLLIRVLYTSIRFEKL